MVQCLGDSGGKVQGLRQEEVANNCQLREVQSTCIEPPDSTCTVCDACTVEKKHLLTSQIWYLRKRHK